jgi:MOSC domain-containing protein YiiM
MGKLEKIWIKRFKRGPMDPVNFAEFIENTGITGNADQNGKRQVTIIEQEKWNLMMKQLKCDLDPSARRANLLISGISLTESRGKILNIGECTIKVYGETRPCERMDEAYNGLRKAMDPNWNGGVYGIIVKGGTIKIGDQVNLV